MPDDITGAVNPDSCDAECILPSSLWMESHMRRSAFVPRLARRRVPTDSKISLAAISLIHLPPAEAVRIAARAGFDQVGIRLSALPNSENHEMLGRSPARDDTLRALAETGMSVLDVEAILLTEDKPPVPLGPLFEATAELNARYITVVCYDPDVNRASDAYAQICLDASKYGISCLIEFMGFSEVKDLQSACAMVERCKMTNSGVLVDPLHLIRTGGTVADLALIPLQDLPYAQLCDARHSNVEPDLAAARQEALKDRLPPGDGVLPLAEFVDALPNNASLSVEVPYVVGRGELEHANLLHERTVALLNARSS
jgi:sugar phosphate isomerase/epimerase